MVTEAQFRADYPEFTDTTKYTSSAFALWSNVAGMLLGPAAMRWDTMFDTGCELVIAHHFAVSARNQLAAAAGGLPGEIAGPVTAKSVDKVSVSRDAGAVTTEGDAFWNMSTYGVEFMMLARLIGAGPIQL